MAILAALAYGIAYLLAHGAPQAVVPAPAAAISQSASPVPAALAADGPPAPSLTPDREESLLTSLCGHGRVTFDTAGLIRDKGTRDADKVLDRAKAALVASKQPRDAALGLFMQQSQASLDALKAMAPGQGDPQVLGLAFLACGYANAGSCEMLLPRQWADAEPDNGIPWMLVAAGAGADKDARNQAVKRAAGARYFDQHAPDYLAMLQWPALRDQPPQTRASLQNQLIGLQMSLPTMLYMPLLQYCGDTSIDQATRQGVCRSLSATLLKDRTLFGYSTGIKLAELAGAPREEIAALRETRAAWQQALSDALVPRQQRAPTECEDMAAMDRLAADYSRLGETGVARRLVEEAQLAAGPALPRR